MITRIITFILLPCLVVALLLSSFGITHVSLGGPVMAFMKAVEMRMNNFTIAIPSIPQIPSTSGGFEFFSMLITFINGIVSVINVLITIVNTAIKVIQFFVTLLISVTELITGIKDYNELIMGGISPSAF